MCRAAAKKVEQIEDKKLKKKLMLLCLAKIYKNDYDDRRRKYEKKL